MRALWLLPFLLVATSAWAELPSADARTISQALNSGLPTMIDLGSRSCNACRKMAPLLERLANEYRGKAHVLFIDVREDDAATKRFGIQMIPTQIFFDRQGQEIWRHIGALEQAEIVRRLGNAGLK